MATDPSEVGLFIYLNIFHIFHMVSRVLLKAYLQAHDARQGGSCPKTTVIQGRLLLSHEVYITGPLEQL